MFSGEAAFKKINKNEYIFVPGSILSSIGYVINGDEKEVIQSSIHKSFRRVVFIVLPAFVLMQFYLLFGCAFFFVSGVVLYLKHHQLINIVLKNKAKVKVNPVGLFSSVKIMAETALKLQGVGGVLKTMFFSLAAFVFVLYYDGWSGSLLTYFLLCLLLVGFLLYFTMLIFMIKKIKDDKKQ